MSTAVNRKPITTYRLIWNPWANEGRILVGVKGKVKPVPVSSPAEFAAIAAVLKESPVFLYQNGTISTGKEPVEERHLMFQQIDIPNE